MLGVVSVTVLGVGGGRELPQIRQVVVVRFTHPAVLGLAVLVERTRKDLCPPAPGT